MVVKQIGKDWWQLTCHIKGQNKLVWFGYTREELIGKLKTYLAENSPMQEEDLMSLDISKQTIH